MTTGSDTQWQPERTSAAANLQGGYANHCDQVQSIKTEFQRVANSLARLGCNGRKEDVINLMAWEIGDLRRAARSRNAIQTAEDGHGEHDFTVFGRAVGSAEQIGNVPDETD